MIDSTIMFRALADSDNKIRSLAVRTCGIVRDKRFASIINSLCAETQPELSSIIFSLGEIKDSSSIGVLLPLIQSNALPYRSDAISAIGHLGNKAATNKLRSFLMQPGYDDSAIPLALWRLADTLSISTLKKAAVQLEMGDSYGAAYALFRMAPDSAIDIFLNEIACEVDSDFVYGMDEETYCDLIQPIAARGLGDGKDTTAILQAFDNYYGSLVRNARIELIRAMGKNKIGRERLENILPGIDDNGIKRVILTALGQIGDRRSFILIVDYLDDSSLQVRLAAVSSLPETDKNGSLKYLADLSVNQLWQIRAEAARAFGKIGLSPAEKRLKQMLTDGDDRVKAAVIEALGEYSVSKNVYIYEAALFGSSDVVVRQIAADVLGNSKDQKAFELLVEAAGKIDSSDSADFCRSLVAALGNFVDSTETGHSAISAIIPFLNHHDRVVRQDAAAALKKFAPADFDPGKFDVVLDKKYYEFIMDLMDERIIAKINTSRGGITVELDPRAAPRTAANFVKLAERKFYDGLTFHRVVENFVVQSGCPRGDGWGDPGYMIREEINPIKFQAGTIGMATSGRDTGGSQFFICHSAQPHLDGRYTAFGWMIEGWDVLNEIEMGDTIYSVIIERGSL